jgi:50S ribosomal subunit-associated GTPase HflX
LNTVHISAAKGIGLTTLLDRIDQRLEADQVSRVHLCIPQKEGKTLAMLEARARIYSRQYRDGLVELEAEAPQSVMRRVREFLVPEFEPIEIPGEPLSETIKRGRR